jgi:cytosine/adenosine deaminase-related metal-dependent hydrolase
VALTSSASRVGAATRTALGRGRWPTSGSWRLIGTVGQVPGPVGARFSHFDLAVSDGVIRSLQPAPPIEHGRDPDGPHLALVPLLVNGHDHGRGRGNVVAGIPDAPLETWIASLASQMGTTTQEALVGDGCRAMLASGAGATVICVNPLGRDTAAEVLSAGRAVSNVGARAAVVYPFADAIGDVAGRARDAPGWSPREADRELAAAEAVASTIDDPLIEVQLGPVGPQWVSETTLAAIGAHARRTGRRVHMHLLESRTQRAWADRTYPEGVVNFLRQHGLVGPHVCFAHGTHLRPDEMAVLAAEGSVLTINASSNLRLASGIPPIASARQSSVHLAIGLDGLALGDDADFWNELRLVRGLAQAQTGQQVQADVLLERLWQGGRRALGSCAPGGNIAGNTADFLLLDVTGYEHLVARADWTIADIVLAVGRPQRVSEVWVGGRQVFCQARPAPASLEGEVES